MHRVIVLLIFPLITVLATACNDDSGSSATTTTSVAPTVPVTSPQAIVSGGGDLTGRQEDIAEIIDRYVLAWTSKDPPGPAWFGSNPEFVWVGVRETTVDDMWGSADWSGLEIVPPVVLVGEHTAVAVTSLGGEQWANVIQFDEDLLVVRHISTHQS